MPEVPPVMITVSPDSLKAEKRGTVSREAIFKKGTVSREVILKRDSVTRCVLKRDSVTRYHLKGDKCHERLF